MAASAQCSTGKERGGCSLGVFVKLRIVLCFNLAANYIIHLYNHDEAVNKNLKRNADFKSICWENVRENV